jgi:hypothetical protein
VGGDAWFGSIPAVVELKKKKNIYSTFILKQHVQYCPKQIIAAVLRARYPRYPAGHHVIMKANISGVDLFLLAYAFSNNDTTFMVSSSGTTVQHKTMYRSNFTDAYGNTTFKEIPRPSIAHFLYELLPLIDNHNKDRQSLLALEDCWPAKSPWFRLVTTLVGMTVTDVQRWDRNNRSERRPLLETRDDDDDPCFLNVRAFANLIAKGLRTPEMSYRTGPRNSYPVRGTDNASGLTRIADKDGNITRMCGKRSREYQRTCFMCKLRHGKHNQNTQWWCKFCHMALCKADRFSQQSCENVHFTSSPGPAACYGPVVRRSFVLQSELERFQCNEDDNDEEEDDNDINGAASGDGNAASLDSQSRSSTATNNVATEHRGEEQQLASRTIETRANNVATEQRGEQQQLASRTIETRANNVAPERRGEQQRQKASRTIKTRSKSGSKRRGRP